MQPSLFWAPLIFPLFFNWFGGGGYSTGAPPPTYATEKEPHSPKRAALSCCLHHCLEPHRPFVWCRIVLVPNRPGGNTRTIAEQIFTISLGGMCIYTAQTLAMPFFIKFQVRVTTPPPEISNSQNLIILVSIMQEILSGLRIPNHPHSKGLKPI